jgi:hypothetical protein
MERDMIINQEPFIGYELYGPYLNKKEDRYYVTLIKGISVYRMLESRYKMCLKEGRLLTKQEEVHHINGDKLNDSIENLEIIDATKHRKLSGKIGRTMVELICPNCNRKFIRERGNTHLVKRGERTFCSRNCNGLYQRHKGSWKGKEKN